MALLTKRGIDKILDRIWETGGMTADMEEDIKRLRDEYDERKGILDKYGEEYDGEEDEYEFKERERTEYDDTESKMWRDRYEEMKRRYKERFFGTDKMESDYEGIIDNTEEDVKRDGRPQTFDELLERVEG